MIPTNFDAKLDPHFGEGKIAPIHADIFIVYAKVRNFGEYIRQKFIVALPPQYTFDETTQLMTDIMGKVLKSQDTYTFDDLDWDTFSNNLDMPMIPVLSYDPRNEELFIWLRPPLELMH